MSLACAGRDLLSLYTPSRAYTLIAASAPPSRPPSRHPPPSFREYKPELFPKLCAQAASLGLRPILKKLDLKAVPRTACPGWP